MSQMNWNEPEETEDDQDGYWDDEEPVDWEDAYYDNEEEHVTYELEFNEDYTD